MKSDYDIQYSSINVYNNVTIMVNSCKVTVRYGQIMRYKVAITMRVSHNCDIQFVYHNARNVTIT